MTTQIKLRDRRIKNAKKIPIYNVWCHMKQRCDKPNDPAYRLYGERGITYDKRWSIFYEFFKDMGETYVAGLTLDRINNNGNYCKENCRWATMEQQANNTRRNHFFTYKGIRDTLTNWAKYMKIKYSTLAMRIHKYGWSFKRSITTGGIN